MKNKISRLNDTAAVAAMPVNAMRAGANRETTESVRQIDNGFITRRSHYDGDRYHSSEVFTPHDSHAAASEAGQGTMHRAKKYLERT